MPQMLIPGLIIGTALGVAFGWILEARHFSRRGADGRFYLAPTLVGNVGSVLLIVSLFLDRGTVVRTLTLLASGAVMAAAVTMRIRAGRRPRTSPAI